MSLVAFRVARLVWPRLVASRRGLLVAALLAWPLTGASVTGFYLDMILPLAALVHATRLVQDEIEARTITYLLSRPVARSGLLLGEMAAYLAAAAVVALPAITIGFMIPGGTPAASLLRLLAAAALALFAFGAVFALLGVAFKRPLAIALVLLFGWERLSAASGLLPRVTLTAYVRALAGASSAPAGVSPIEAVLVLACVGAVCLSAAALVFSGREYVSAP